MNEQPPVLSLMQMTFGYLAPRCLHVVTELGVADSLADTAQPATALASQVGADADVLNRLLRLLVAHGIFEQTPDGYRNNGISSFLRRDHPQSMRAFVRMIGRNYNWDSYRVLEDAARTGVTPIESVCPGGLWEIFRADPDEARIFNEAMSSKSSDDIAALLRSYDYSQFPTIADIGAGAGHLIKAILAAAPATRGILFDLPHVASTVPPSDHLALHPGDFFADALPSADCYLLMNIIHDWADRESSQILSAIARAATPGTHLHIVETILPEGPAMHFSKILDVHMLTVTGGRERTLAEYTALLASAGFRLNTVVDTVTPYSIIDSVYAP